MKIDLHVHLEKRPYPYARKALQLALEAGMDGVCFTEHNDPLPPEYFKNLREDVMAPVFWACEYSSREGHILVFTPGEKFEFESLWRPMQEIIDLARELGGIAIPVHPYSTLHSTPLGDGVFQLKNLEAIETVNGGLSHEDNIKAEKARSRLGIAGIGGSDAHNEFMTGRAYTVFEENIKTPAQLVKALTEGIYNAEYWKKV